MVVTDLNADNFNDFIKEDCIIDFYADWCGPCKMMKPHFEKASESIKDVKFGKVNVDSNQDLAQRFQVMSIPTTILFKGGEQVERQSGALSGDEIKSLTDKAFK